MKCPKLLLTVPFLFSIMGCGGNGSYAGTYSFQLGQKQGTHAAITITLMQDDFPTENPELQKYNPKRFTIDFDIGGITPGGNSNESTPTSETSQTNETSQTSETSQASESSEEPGTINPPSSINEMLSDFTMISGYYYTNNEHVKTGEVLHLGISLLNDEYNIGPEITEKILYSTINSGELTVVIPVSFEDLFYQLYFYGYRVGSILEIIDPVNIIEEDPAMAATVGEQNIGKHPTKEQITIIQSYQTKRQNDKPEGYRNTEEKFVNYRDFHTLSMGLKKNG